MAETNQAGDMKHDSISSPGISDQEKEMASSAFEAFKTGSYDESLKHLDSLQELNKEDYKITMNKAITEFYKSGQTTTSTLKQTLMTLKNQMHTAVDDIDGLDDVENSILYYNQAVIHYHMRQYSEAISIVEKLYQFLEPFEEKFAQTQEGDKFIPAAPSSPLRKQEVENLRCSILACSAYVALALGDNLMALNHAEKLLHQTKLSGSLKFLGHLYAAEALISLDRISDAIAHLNPENVTDVSLGVSSSEQEQASDKGDLEPVESSGKQTPLCYPSSVSSARATMLFNLGSAYCLRSEYEKARKCLHQAASMVNTKEIPPEAILLGVYLELQNGNTQLALQIIKRNQLLPSVKPASSPDLRKKPLPFQSSQPVQPIQTPSSFTQVQRK
uniref:CCR4-NOT transcription complex subunit 10 n=1 Tax=Cyprinus carpio TaxID=7962 RepID=A0A8C1T4L0_CYPCA